MTGKKNIKDHVKGNFKNKPIYILGGMNQLFSNDFLKAISPTGIIQTWPKVPDIWLLLLLLLLLFYKHLVMISIAPSKCSEY
jgi:hypothetical protein